MQLGGMPPWSLSVALIAGALLVTLLAYEGFIRALRRVMIGRNPFVRSLIVRTRGPGRLALILGAVSWAIGISPLPSGPSALVQHGLLVGAIALAGWTVLTAMDIALALHLRKYRLDVADNLLARKHLTQARILRRAASILVILITTGVALMTMPTVRQLGVSLLAAGGAAGVIVGLALQPILSNLMAGVQIALTQPIRLDDAVMVENEFGNVEEINSAYVVVRLWDLRRLVVPLKYFLEKPFQNWTRESSNLLGAVLLYVDYSAPVDRLRETFQQIVEGSPLWDGQTAVLQVTDARERTMELRCLASAGNSSALSNLRCEIREKMVAYIQAEFPDALPRDRVEPADREPAPAPARRARDPADVGEARRA
jgi:small-conductance mechanosensitive channel